LFKSVTSQICFVPRTDYSVGSQPYGIIAADFNMDGNLDLAFPNLQDNNLSVMFGSTNGTFGAATNYTTSNFPQAIHSANFNADAFPDIAYTCSGSVYVMLNNGSGGFGAALAYTGSSTPLFISSGDFNGDSFIDIVTANSTAGNISLFLGNGLGAFGAATNFIAAAGTNALTCADVNGDGLLDVVTSNGTANNVSVFIGNGAGSFAARINYATSSAIPSAIVSVDIDLDGDKDIVVANQNSSFISVLKNNGLGVFSAATTFTAVTNNMSSISSKDFNSDGKPDIVVNLEPMSSIAVFLGDGLGAFGPATLVTTDIAPRFLCTGDFNGDGKFDVATSNLSSNSVSILLNNVLPVVHASASDTLLCANESVTLNGTGATTYTWAPGFPAISNGVAFLQQVGSVTYTVTGSLNGCIDKDTLTITVAPLPTLILNNNITTVCPNVFVTLNATGDAASYTWDSGVINGVPFLPTQSYQTFSVTATSAYGCKVFDSKTVQVLSSPTAVISASSIVPCVGDNFLLNSTGSTISGNGNTYQWTGPTNGTPAGTTPNASSTSITSPGTYTFTLIDNYANCFNTATITVNFNPLPTVNAVSSSTYLCAGSAIVLSGSGTATNYTWSNGVINNSPFIINATHNYTVTGTNTITGCSNTAQVLVATTTSVTPQICMVTVDDPGDNNIIYWDKTSYGGADTFFVYREITNGNYQIIGRVPYDSLSQFVDTVRTLYFPNTGDPRSSSFKYKLAIKDTCGNISDKSPFHATMFLQDQFNSNFNWTHYQIEGQNSPSTPVPALTYYLMLRDNNLDGIYETTIGSTVASSASDPQYFTYQNTANWRIETVWSISCDPALRPGGNNEVQTSIVKSKSNIKNNFTVTGIKDGNLSRGLGFKVYPNPANEILNIEISLLKETQATIIIENTLGQIVYAQLTDRMLNQLNISSLVRGVYFVKLNIANEVFVQKTVID
jgi:hypothetical protein